MSIPLGPWEIDGKSLKTLSDEGLRLLVQLLLEAETPICEMRSSEVRTAADIDTSDEGCDAYTPANNGASDDFVPSQETCWQFKAGKAGGPGKMSKEIGKPKPKEILERKGAFVVIASAAVNGKTGEDNRLKVLIEAAKSKGIPYENLRVMGSENLAKWCNKFPSIVKRYSDISSSLVDSKSWFDDEQFSGTYNMGGKIEQAMIAVRDRFETSKPEDYHTHIFGQLGVGKTRFCLEACKGSRWKHCVVYAPFPEVTEIQKFLDIVSSRPEIRVVLVVDECSQEVCDSLCRLVSPLRNQVHLMTIGQEKPVQANHTATVEIAPLDEQELSKFLKEVYPSIPQEHVAVITRYSEGYVKFARIIADSLQTEAPSSVLTIMRSDPASNLMNRLLNGVNAEDRDNLRVLALLENVGCSGVKEAEGRTLVTHFGLNWGKVQQTIRKVHARYGIVPGGGELRYVSPKPLAIYLAMEALEIHQEAIKNLSDALAPYPAAQKSFLKRLHEIATEPIAQEVCKEMLASFLTMSDFNDPTKVRVWEKLNVADPINAAKNLEAVLRATPIEERKNNTGNARRALVRSLEHLCWSKDSFEPAIQALAHLAVAENETWNNNSTGEFVSYFQLFLGGTSTPYLDRLKILDELMGLGDEYRKLGVSALLASTRTSFVRSGGREEFGPRVNEQEWQPKTRGEQIECCRQALDRIGRLVDSGDPTLAKDFSKAASDALTAFHESSLFDECRELIRKVVKNYPEEAENIRKAVSHLLWMHKVRKDEDRKNIGKLKELHTELSGDEFSERVRSFVGPWAYDVRDAKDKVEELAEAFIQDPTLLDYHKGWLISGEANNVWEFGLSLGRKDTEGALIFLLWEKRADFFGKDIRLLAAYLQGRADILGLEFISQKILELNTEDEGEARMLVELVWRTLPNEEGANYIISLLKRENIPDGILNSFAYGNWGNSIPFASHKKLISMLSNKPKWRALSLSLVSQRVSNNKTVLDDAEYWKLAKDLASDAILIIGENKTYIYDWESLAEVMLEKDAEMIVNSIFESQNKERYWFISHSSAERILEIAAEKDAELVWRLLSKRLEHDPKRRLFVIGFPDGLMNKLPVNKIIDWCRTKPEERATSIAHMCSANFADDTTLFSLLAENFGDMEEVDSALSATFHSRSWTGSEADMLKRLEQNLQEASSRTKLAGLRAWITRQLPYVQSSEKRARFREEEEDIRGFRGGN